MSRLEPPDPKHTNRLVHEASPYLLQHAHNPVDWHPWGAEAFEIARRDDKPIFLSVGYSTCYWCHVMERQCFENERVAAEMNKRFVNIKVDREERPDVDQLYMTVVQALTRHGGWPMSVWLAPDLRPFYAGTYFPPEDAYGRPGFVSLLAGIEDAYRNRKGEVERAAAQLVEVLRDVSEPPRPSETILIDDRFVEDLIDRSTSDYEPRFGGFGRAPKFPRETLLELLLVHNRRHPNERRMKMLRHALDAMADGGIRDQLGGGFHRYSTDSKWLVPHFEIMLYDNAMLAWVYAEAHRQTGHVRYGAVARDVLDFTLREMTSPEGAFYTAFDAEVDALEGASYLWKQSEIESLLGPDDAKLFNRVYGVDLRPNFTDPHHSPSEPDRNILYLPKPMSVAARELGVSDAELELRLKPMRQTLLAARAKRKQPLLDTKVITSWNALMIRAMAHVGNVLGESQYVVAAVRAAEFLLHSHRFPDRRLHRMSREGVSKHHGFLDDYAFFAQALLALHAATGEARWRREAEDVARRMVQQFGDDLGGGFYFTGADATDLIVRQKIASDSPLPSGNAVAAMVLHELGEAEAAAGVIAVFAESIVHHGESMSAMVQAAAEHLAGRGALKVAKGESVPSSPAAPVSAEVEWATPTELRVRLRVPEGFHLHSNESTSAEAPIIATHLMVEAEGAVAEVRYPPAKPITGVAATGYEGEVMIVVCFDLPPSSPPRLRLGYQACTDRACLAPAVLSIPLK